MWSCEGNEEMRKRVIVLCAALGLFACWMGIGVAAPVNLLKNTEFAPAAPAKPGEIADWIVAKRGAWERKEIVAFQGRPFPFAYLDLKGGGVIRQQHIPVEPNTWYVITAWCKAELKAGPGSHTVWLYATAPDAKRFERLGGSIYGAVGDWVQLRTLFNSGDRTEVGLGVWFHGSGTAALGECSLHKLSEADYAGPYVLDPDFEKGVEGLEPVDFWAQRDKPQPAIATDGQFVRGKQSMKLVIPAGESGSLYGPQAIPCVQGTGVVYSVWAKATIRDTKVVLTVQGPGGRPYRTRRDFLVGTEWARLQMEAAHRGTDPVGLFLSCRAPQDEDVTLWFDDVSVQLDSPGTGGDAAAATVKNPLLNSSFEAGVAGWDFRILSSNIMDDTPEIGPASFEVDGTTATEGMCSLKFKVPDGLLQSKFGGTPQGGYVSCAYVPARVGEKYTISFDAKASAQRPVRLSLTHRFENVFGLSTEWKRYSAEVVPATTREGYLSFRFYFPQGGTYWLDAVQFEKGAQTDYTPPANLEVGAVCTKPFAWHVEGEKPQATLYACSRLKQDTNLRLAYTVKDWRRRVVDSRSIKLNAPAGKTVTHPLSLPGDKLGTFLVEFDLQDPVSKEKATQACEYIYGVFPKPTDIDPEEAFFGVHTFCLWYDRLYTRQGTLEDIYRLVRLCGARWGPCGGPGLVVRPRTGTGQMALDRPLRESRGERRREADADYGKLPGRQWHAHAEVGLVGPQGAAALMGPRQGGVLP